MKRNQNNLAVLKMFQKYIMKNPDVELKQTSANKQEHEMNMCVSKVGKYLH